MTRQYRPRGRQNEKTVERLKAQQIERVLEYVDNGDEEAFVKQIKAAFPAISGAELIEKIALFRELKRIRSGLS